MYSLENVDINLTFSSEYIIKPFTNYKRLSMVFYVTSLTLFSCKGVSQKDNREKEGGTLYPGSLDMRGNRTDQHVDLSVGVLSFDSKGYVKCLICYMKEHWCNM